MHLNSLSIEYFRSHTEKTWDFQGGITLIVGKNGVGKTNILEAISSLAFTRPFRSRDKGVFIQYDKPYAKISGITENPHERLDIFWENTRGKKTVFRHNEISLSPSEYLKKKNFQIVLFSPEEINLPFGTPKIRRIFLASFLAPIFPDYFEAALKYESVLRHRNRLLVEYREKRAQKEEFYFWDLELEKWGKILITKRREFFLFAREQLSKKYTEIAGKTAELMIFPEETIIDEDFQGYLKKTFQKDVLLGVTSIGPHRDDFSLFLNNKKLSESGSRGEVRSALLALLLVQKVFLEKHTGISPILLMDDALSELDENRQENILSYIYGSQVIITTTHIPKLFTNPSVNLIHIP
jgi:DNA replication and repair protein RecF